MFKKLTNLIFCTGGRRMDELLKLVTETKNLLTAMSDELSDFLTTQEAFNARQGAAINQLVTAFGSSDPANPSGLAGDVAELNRQIEDLRNSSSPISGENRERIDRLKTAGEAATVKLETIASGLKALDEATPPRPGEPGTETSSDDSAPEASAAHRVASKKKK